MGFNFNPNRFNTKNFEVSSPNSRDVIFNIDTNFTNFSKNEIHKNIRDEILS